MNGYIIWSKNLIPITASLVIFTVLLVLFLLPHNYPKSSTSSSGFQQYCREFLNDPNSTRIEVPSTPDGGANVTYRLIKQRVPINPGGFQGDHHIQQGGNITVGEENFQLYYPNPEIGRSYDFNTEDGITDINFIDNGLLFLLHLDDAGQPEPVDVNYANYQMIDIYQDVSKPPLERAENILKCIDIGTAVVINLGFVIPPQAPSAIKDQLQLEWFLLRQSKFLPKAWWTPECKPAVYLYPPNKTLVNVKVYPEGFLTYTDPVYDYQTGWNVEANPDGTIITREGKSYPYLYFESKVRDEVIDIPGEGWVVKSSGNKVSEETKETKETKETEDWFIPLEEHFNQILPKLGLNKTQTNDFVEYWKKVLSYSPYYFVGIIEQSNVNEIERLEITPKPDSVNRVRIYFERLGQPKQVQAPDLSDRNFSNSDFSDDAFRVVEWGGMVKNDLEHPFTCSQ